MRALVVVVVLCTARVVTAQPIDGERTEATLAAGMQTTPLPIVSERLAVAIEGQHASTTLTQVYRSTATTAIEGRYRLRPGTGAHVDGFAYWNGETKIVGEVFEKATARAVYDTVTRQGRDPGLLEQEGEGQFAFQVFPIEPNVPKRLELRWSKLLPRVVKTVRYRAPLASANPEIQIDITATVTNVRVSGFALARTVDGDGVTHLHGTGGPTTPGGAPAELVVEWDVGDAPWTPTTWVHPGDQASDGWFTLALAAPDLPASATTPKDVTIVIDHSGSMTGEPMEHAKAAAIDMIRILDPKDRVNVIGFDDDTDPLYPAPRLLDGKTRDEATGFVERLRESGGTDIARALALAIASQDGRRPRIVVFMTDGQSEVPSAIAAAAADKGDVRLFTVGLGKAVNKPFLARLAAVKRGRFLYIERANAIEAEVSRLATQISRPLLVDVSVEVEGAVASRMYPRTLPDVFAEDQLVVSGRVRGNGVARFIVRGKLEGQPVSFTRTVDLGKPAKRPWVGRVWAQARVDHLLEEIELGGQAPELRTEVIELALAYNFVTPFTSFLAIPESELGVMRGTVEAARAHKAEVLAKRGEVARLDPVAGDVDALDDDRAPRRAQDRDFASAPTSTSFGEVTRRRGGCAGCSTGEDGGAAVALAA
ncbi:MAG: VIT and VWA domain-containing protein, partial [Proteobacteria bacterium]|nr:VIT and VWA domain-containing protein [Pseudomonadota bacterium]